MGDTTYCETDDYSDIEIPAPKNRWLETEWYLTLGTIIFGILLKMGYITPTQSDAMIQMLNEILGLAAIIAPTLGWQFSRAKQKKAYTKSVASLYASKAAARAQIKDVCVRADVQAKTSKESMDRAKYLYLTKKLGHPPQPPGKVNRA